MNHPTDAKAPATNRPLNRAELRFLRLEMETTQRDLAALVGTSEQTLRL
jgi:putative transcriptional regulator